MTQIWRPSDDEVLHGAVEDTGVALVFGAAFGLSRIPYQLVAPDEH